MFDATKNLSAFQTRLKELRGSMSRKEAAEKIGISRAALGFYEDGSRKPDIEILLKIANAYEVTCDYLLGNTDVKENSQDIRQLADSTGLDVNSILWLMNHKAMINENDIESNEIIQILDWLIKSGLIYDIYDYLYFDATHFVSESAFPETANPFDESNYMPISDLMLLDSRRHKIKHSPAGLKNFSLLCVIDKLMAHKNNIKRI